MAAGRAHDHAPLQVSRPQPDWDEAATEELDREAAGEELEADPLLLRICQSADKSSELAGSRLAKRSGTRMKRLTRLEMDHIFRAGSDTILT